jgi:phosphate starvation-inducible PhoH-like protein
VRALFGWNPTAQDDGPDRDQSFLKKVKPRTAGQEKLMDAIDSNPLVVAIGPAGTGKTYLAISKAVEALEAGRVSRIVLSRPAVEAGESIGFLPGHME